ncbi:conserved hypothetical protein [Gammaproteobacteria bacterium]
MSLYETDFYTWTQEQAALLKAGRLSELDVAGLIEEVEDMGRSERRELENRLEVLLTHLLKWRYQPKRKGKSWHLTIREQRWKVALCLQENPSMKLSKYTFLANAYKSAVWQAARETKLDESIFPIECPWTFEQVMNDEFWPD